MQLGLVLRGGPFLHIKMLSLSRRRAWSVVVCSASMCLADVTMGLCAGALGTCRLLLQRCTAMVLQAPQLLCGWLCGRLSQLTSCPQDVVCLLYVRQPAQLGLGLSVCQEMEWS